MFQADAVVTSFMPGQTLNTTDQLDGGDGHNILNAQLVNYYTAPAALKSIQTINLSQVGQIGEYYPLNVQQQALPGSYNVLDLVNADATKELGFNGFAGPASIDILNVNTEVEAINFSNIYNYGMGEDLRVYVENTSTSLIGDNALRVNLSNVSGEVDLELEQTETISAGYETINVNVTGSQRNNSTLHLSDDNATVATVNVSGNATTFAIAGSALDLDHLTTFDASEFVGNLGAVFTGGIVSTTGEVADVSVTGSQGDNDLLFTDTKANLTIKTFAGDDLIAVGDATVVDGSVVGNVSVDAGQGVNAVVITDVVGNIAVTAGDGGNDISITNISPAFSDDVLVLGAIAVETGAGDDNLNLDTARFSSLLAGTGVTVDLGDGNDTLLLGGSFGGSVSFDDATIDNVETLEVTTAVTSGGAVTVDISELADALQTVQFDLGVNQINGAIVIDGGPKTLALTVNEGATFAGALQVNDVVNLTLNVNDGTTGDSFDISAGTFIAASLKTLTVNLENNTSFLGAVAAVGTNVNKLTTVTVNGTEAADGTPDFSMDFDDTQSAAISTIDLSDFAGDAVINTFHNTGTGFGTITTNVGTGNLAYNIHDGLVKNSDLFVFAQNFGHTVIDGFEIGGAATADILDLSAYGITSGAGLVFTIDANSDLVITARTGQFEGDIKLVGTFTAPDAAVVAANNIYYA